MNRMPLSDKEYYALLEIFGIVNSFNNCAGTLKRRCALTPGAWNNLQTVIQASEQLMEQLVQTVPKKKISAIQKDLQFARCQLKVTKDFTGQTDLDGFSYVHNKPLGNVVARLINQECQFCDKGEAESKQCPVLKDIEALYPWDMPPKKNGCPLQGEGMKEIAE